MNEKLLEKKLVKAVEQIGGKAIKFTSPYYIGMPDRIVLLPGGRIRFVELKTTGKKPSAIQLVRIKMLQQMGFAVYVVDSQTALDAFLEVIT